MNCSEDWLSARCLRGLSTTLSPPLPLFERSEFLIDTSQKQNLSVCVDVRLILVLVLGRQTVRLCGCSANLGFSVRSANRIRPKHGIPLPVIVFENTHTHIATAASEA